MLDDIAFARALHVLAVAHWIGGVAFVTLIVLPLARSRGSIELFAAVERRFAAQVRFSIPLVGATGLWMTWRLDLWVRFVDWATWWMAAMAALWLIFMLMLFVIEPLLHPWFEREGQRDPPRLLRRMGILHAALLVIAGITIMGAVAGSHGGLF
jgi:uncharacterized membrane protein